MVATFPAARFQQDLESHDIQSRLSRVRPVSCPVEPMGRYRATGSPFVSRDARVNARLRQLQSLCEWAYGFREPSHPGKRLTRRVPSAGALYPTELFLVLETEQGWRTLYYDFHTHRFFLVPAADTESVRQCLGLERGSECILLVSVLWRTVQRYGVRGYRYCLLDAAHVASNLLRVGRGMGQAPGVALHAPTLPLEAGLRLDHGEALVLALRTGTCPDDACPPEPPLLEMPGLRLGLAEAPPLMCPVLERTILFHRRCLADGGQEKASAWSLPVESPEALADWAHNRCSAKGFTGAAVGVEQFEQMARVVSSFKAPFGGRRARLHARVLALRLDGLPAGVVRLHRRGELEWRTTPHPAERLPTLLREASQNQRLVESCAFALVLAAEPGELVAAEHVGYGQAVLNAGFACAELYREAARLGLGTTTIGGFSDTAISQLLGEPLVHPLVMQIFGVPDASVSKEDAARLVGLREARSVHPQAVRS